MESTSHPASGRMSLWAAGAEGLGNSGMTNASVLSHYKIVKDVEYVYGKGCGMCM